jgi:hypothetical protein
MKTHHRTRLISTVLLAGLLSLLLGCMALGLLARGWTPSFYLSVWLGQRQAIILRNGPTCRPELTRGACLSGITEQTFHIIAWQPEGSQVLLSIRE